MIWSRSEKELRCWKSRMLIMNNDQLVLINLAAILVGTTFNSEQKAIKWGAVIIAVASVVSSIIAS